jgi:3',5'-cyclic AMP phosphodiesterase CpdA
MSHHFSNTSHKQKRTYDNFKSALLECNKYNSKIDNLGTKKKVPYLCKICDKVHIGSDYKNIITFKVQEEALKKRTTFAGSSMQGVMERKKLLGI